MSLSPERIELPHYLPAKKVEPARRVD